MNSLQLSSNKLIFILAAALCAPCLPVSNAFAAEDSVSPQRTRAYFSLRYGRNFYTDNDIAPGFELNGSGGQEWVATQIGFNWGRYLGLEAAVDFYESDLEAAGTGKIKEYTVYSFIPQLRLRYPLMNDRLTPYLIAGAGVAISETNDATPLSATPGAPSFGGRDTALIYAFGGGIEYFIMDNVAIGAEVRYVNHDAEIETDGVKRSADLDAIQTSFGVRLFFPGPAFESSAFAAGTHDWLAIDKKNLVPYFGFQVGYAGFLDDEISPTFSFSDNEKKQIMAVSGGIDLNRYLGVELVLSQYGGEIHAENTALGSSVKVVEHSTSGLIPQLRVRYPMMSDKLVPYLLAGVGVGLAQTNDRTPNGARPEVPRFTMDDYAVVASFGVGAEYFIASNMSVGVESAYRYHRAEAQIGNTTNDVDLDIFSVTAGMRVYFR